MSATLGDVMSTQVATVDANATVADATDQMVRGRFGSIVVVRGDMIEGIFTERDVLRAVSRGADPGQAKVSEWMTADPVTADPSLDCQEAAETMLSGGFRHLPVVEDDRLAGIVSLRDLLKVQIGGSG